jgi:hypothetical protein
MPLGFPRGVIPFAAIVAIPAVFGCRGHERPGPSQTSDPTTQPSAPSAQPGSSQSPISEAGSKGPRVVPTRDGGPGPVKGPTYGPHEETYRMDLEGFPFGFDVPGTWGCIPSRRKEFLAASTCIDEGDPFGSGAKGSGAGALQKCLTPCGESERAGVRAQLAIDAKEWKKIDVTTMYAEIHGQDEGKSVVRIAMAYVFASNRGGPLDRVALAQLTGPPKTEENLLKIMNDMREQAAK